MRCHNFVCAASGRSYVGLLQGPNSGVEVARNEYIAFLLPAV